MVIQFYCNIIGLEQLGGSQNHDGYNGIFIGLQGADWHLEFTTSADAADHHADEDDLLVFYTGTEVEIENILQKAQKQGIAPGTPKNPYWKDNGYLLRDPDGFGVMLSLRSPKLTAQDALTAMVHAKGISDWNAMVQYIRRLPYGRNENRYDPSLVLTEERGTCSSKHALLKSIANLNGIPHVKLITGIYKMNEQNTPKIGSILQENGIAYIPEAHCYLLLNGHRIDLTTPNASFSKLEADLLQELELQPDQVGDFKVAYHKEYLQKWLPGSGLTIGFDELWQIREQCIRNLSE